MVLGDGVRRDVARVSEDERVRLREAFQQLDTSKYTFPDGVTYWDKQEEVHKGAHAAGQDVHGGPAFLPWHRELVDRLEGLLRRVDPDLSLHYWDWTTDPRVSGVGRAALFTTTFMGSASGDIGEPFPDFETTEPGSHTKVWRNLAAGPPVVADLDNVAFGLGIALDDTILTVADQLPREQQYTAMDAVLQGSHNYIHSRYIRGTIANPHFSFHDPFVFLLHSNVDRLWARWQKAPGHAWRLDPDQVYGTPGTQPASSVNAPLQPWAGGADGHVRPWSNGEDPMDPPLAKTAKDPTIVEPPQYDR
ncbi:tyrosinase family protein [Streptomyces sp. NPDC047081]|uniref:tyrosinase family protein n=1 Tax=Streptomyces sp. NPDC047081 TaxID=3154706 RepID=UPI0033CFEB82